MDKNGEPSSLREGLNKVNEGCDPKKGFGVFEITLAHEAGEGRVRAKDSEHPISIFPRRGTGVGFWPQVER
jgi:hypothetical protein